MKLKHLRVTLPGSMAATSAHDARAIAQAVGNALAKGNRPDGPIEVNATGQREAVLATQVTTALKGGSNGR